MTDGIRSIIPKVLTIIPKDLIVDVHVLSAVDRGSTTQVTYEHRAEIQTRLVVLWIPADFVVLRLHEFIEYF